MQHNLMWMRYCKVTTCLWLVVIPLCEIVKLYVEVNGRRERVGGWWVDEWGRETCVCFFFFFLRLTHRLTSMNSPVAQSICRSQSCCKNKIKHLHFCLTAPGWTDLHSVSFTVCSGMWLAGRSQTNSVWKLFWGNWKYYCSQTGYSRDLCNSSVQLPSHGCQYHFNANEST